MKNTIKNLIALLCLLPGLLSVGVAQHSANSAGGQATGTGGVSSFSLGQVVYSYYSNSTGSSTQGVQQVYLSGLTSCPVITAPDSAGCSGTTLAQMTADLSGGTWSAVSSIGTTVSIEGVVTLGINPNMTPDQDTIVYTANGCEAMVEVTVYPTPLITAGETTGCAGGTLPALQANIPGGTWSAVSSIGTTVSAEGIVTLGLSQTTVIDRDTIIYTINGCSTSVVVTSSLSGAYCLCEAGELLLEGIVPSGTYSAVSRIESNGEVQGGSTVVFQAGERITLLPGFQAHKGSDFHALIGQCVEGTEEQGAQTDESDLVAQQAGVSEEQEKGKSLEMRESKMAAVANLGNAALSRVWPNPFSDYFVLEVDLPQMSRVSARLQNIHGGDVVVLLEGEELPTGLTQYRLGQARLPGGMYLLTVVIGNKHHVHRLIQIQ